MSIRSNLSIRRPGNQKLSEDDVRAIKRELQLALRSRAEIALAFGVSVDAIKDIAIGRRWSDVPWPEEAA